MQKRRGFRVWGLGFRVFLPAEKWHDSHTDDKLHDGVEGQEGSAE
jgi:hypothetical protein